MSYIDTTVSEGNLLNDLLMIYSEKGWTKERYFKRTAFNASMINPIVPQLAITSYDVCIAEHMILKHPKKDFYYGFAVAGKFNVLYGSIPEQARPMTSMTEITSAEADGYDFRSSDDFAAWAEWITNKWPPYKQTHTLYTYMIEKVPEEFEENKDACIAWTGDLLQASLDVGVIETGYKVVQGSPKMTVYNAKETFRSPVATMRLRIPTLQTSVNQYGADFPVIKNNWHPDSRIELKGLLDEEKAMLIIRADTQAAYENNAVPSIPLYMGSFDKVLPEDDGNYCLMTGSAFPNETPTLDYDNNQPMNVAINPLLRPEGYPVNQGNGVDNIIVHRNKLGSRYQMHVLYVDTAPNEMEPLRTYNGRDYPRAWQQPEADVFKYKHNPSEYTDQVSSSPAYIFAPEGGLRGKLSDVIVCNPIGIRDYAKLKHRLNTCPDTYEKYLTFVTEAVSPLSKVPGTPYHSLAIGLSLKSAAPAPL